MIQQVELDSFDLRYESCRQQSMTAEKTLIDSIRENGIRESLQGVDSSQRPILLNGFKRYRCARKLGISMVPYQSLAADEAAGILELIRLSTTRGLTILEQAQLIHQLRAVHKMSTAEIATDLEKSTGWVSMRTGMIHEMSDVVKAAIFSGDFPAYSYLYTLRRFIRMNDVPGSDIDDFVSAVAGKKLSIRNIETLAQGYFCGGETLRRQIKKGDIDWGLRQLHKSRLPLDDCTEVERGMMRDLECTHKYLRRTMHTSSDDRLCSSSFYAQAHLLCDGLLRMLPPFQQSMESLHDRCSNTQGN